MAESVNAFAQVCLGPNLTGNRALAAAKSIGAALSAPPMLKSVGKPAVSVVARIKDAPVSDPDAPYDWFNCNVELRGTWADAIAADVKSRLQSAGFRFAGFQREAVAPSAAYRGAEIVTYTGGATRNGRSYVITAKHQPSGAGTIGEFRAIAKSGTSIEIETR